MSEQAAGSCIKRARAGLQAQPGRQGACRHNRAGSNTRKRQGSPTCCLLQALLLDGVRGSDGRLQVIAHIACGHDRALWCQLVEAWAPLQQPRISFPTLTGSRPGTRSPTCCGQHLAPKGLAVAAVPAAAVVVTQPASSVQAGHCAGIDGVGQEGGTPLRLQQAALAAAGRQRLGRRGGVGCVELQRGCEGQGEGQGGCCRWPGERHCGGRGAAGGGPGGGCRAGEHWGGEWC